MTSYYKGSFLFLDWCPAPNGVSNLVYDRYSIETRQDQISAIIEKTQSKYQTLIDSINYSIRDDGIFLFFVNFRHGVDYPDLREASRYVSMHLKSNCFDHRHTHHAVDGTVIESHYPIFCDLRALVKDNCEADELPSVAYENFSDENRQSFLNETVKDASRLLVLRKSSQRTPESSQFAAIELKHILSTRHDVAMEHIDSIKTYYKEARRFTIIEAAAISGGIFVLILSLDGFDLSSKYLIKSGASGVIVFFSYIYVKLQVFRISKILRTLNTAIGFFYRTSTYCNRISLLYDSLRHPVKDDLCFGTESGFGGYIGSLEQLKDRYKSDLDRRFVVVGIVMAVSALVVTIAAI